MTEQTGQERPTPPPRHSRVPLSAMSIPSSTSPLAMSPQRNGEISSSPQRPASSMPGMGNRRPLPTAPSSPELTSPDRSARPLGSALDDDIDPMKATSHEGAEETGSVTPTSKRSRREEILEEIVESERNYVEALHYLVTSYLDPLKASESILAPALATRIFSSIELIKNVNSELLAALQASQAQRLGEIFLEFAPYLKLYNQYSANYEDAIRTLEAQKNENEGFAHFLEQVGLAAEKAGQHTNISFYLIMPIQRIPRYIMLLTDLLKETPPDHEDYEGIQKALHQVKAVADIVNNSVREVEHIMKTAQIQACLVGYDGLVIPSRRLIHEGGTLQKISTKGALLPRCLLLFNDLLLLTEGKLGQKQYLKEAIPIHLSWTKALPDAEKLQHCFQIASQAKTSVLMAPTAKDRDRWMQQIAETRASYLAAHPDLAEARSQVERCLQPRLHAKVFQIDEYVDPQTSTASSGAPQPRQTVVALRILEDLSSTTTIPVEIETVPITIRGTPAPAPSSSPASRLTVSLTPPVLASTTGKGKTHAEKKAEGKTLRLPASELEESPLRSGYLTKQGGVRTSWKRRWFVLQGGFLFYYKNRNEDPSGVISVRGCVVQGADRTTGKEHSWSISPKEGQGRTYLMYAASHDDAQAWQTIIQEATHGLDSHLTAYSLIPWVYVLFQHDGPLAREAAHQMIQYGQSFGSDSDLVTFLRHGSSYRFLCKLLSTAGSVYTPVQVALLRKLAPLSPVEEVGKAMLAYGLIDCLYIHLDAHNPAHELQEETASLIACLSRFDWFPCTSALALLFPLLLGAHAERGRLLYHLVTIIRNLAPLADFRKLVLAHEGMACLFQCLSSPMDEALLEKLLQAILLLICDDSQCKHSQALLHMLRQSPAVPALLPVLESFSHSSKVCWPLLKIINTLAVGTLESKYVPCLLHWLESEPMTSALLFELVRLFNMISRDQWIRCSLDEHSGPLIHCLLQLLQSNQDPRPVREITLRCLTNLCASDKNKNALQAEDGLRVLLSQTTLDPPNVPVSALRCLEYALMNEKNRVAFAQPTYLETLRPLLTPQEDHRILCGALAVVEASLSPACLTIATLLAKDSTLGQVLGMSSQSPLIPVRAHTMRAVACLAWARPMGSLLISSLPWDALLQDENMFVALHTAGTLTNLYRATLDTSPGELPWEGIVKSLFALLDRASNPQEMKIVMQTLTSLAHHGASWRPCLASEMERLTPWRSHANAPLKNQTEDFFLAMEGTLPPPKANSLRYRPRFAGYHIV